MKYLKQDRGSFDKVVLQFTSNFDTVKMSFPLYVIAIKLSHDTLFDTFYRNLTTEVEQFITSIVQKLFIVTDSAMFFFLFQIHKKLQLNLHISHRRALPGPV